MPSERHFLTRCRIKDKLYSNGREEQPKRNIYILRTPKQTPRKYASWRESERDGNRFEDRKLLSNRFARETVFKFSYLNFLRFVNLFTCLRSRTNLNFEPSATVLSLIHI